MNFSLRLDRTRRAAFTLVELLVVIGIISVLISVLLPAMNKARQQAVLVQCQSNMRQFGIAFMMYAGQSKGFLPWKGPDGSNTGSNNFGPTGGVIGVNDPSIWFNAIPPLCNKKSYYDLLVDDQRGITPVPHAGMNSIFMCPAASIASSQGTNDIVYKDWFLLYGSDSTNVLTLKQFKFAASYVMNSKLSTTIASTTDTTLNISRLRTASEIVLMTEKMNNYGEYRDPAVQAYNAKYPGVYAGKINAQGYNNKLGQSKADFHRFTTIHNHGGNLLFADGHVAWFAWADVQIPASQMPYDATKSDANQPGKIRWSALGPVN